MSTPNRQPKGIPTGGQFSASQKAEASVSLSETADEDLDVYLMTDQPTDCPRCQRRSLFEDVAPGRERHTCPGCGYVFMVHSPEVDGEEQCEVCREFTPLDELDEHQVCPSCRVDGGGWCDTCDDYREPGEDHEHDDEDDEDEDDEVLDQAPPVSFSTGRCSICNDAILVDAETAAAVHFSRFKQYDHAAAFDEGVSS